MKSRLLPTMLGIALSCGVTWAGDAPAPTSTAAKYARINLSSDGSKALMLAFDESKGAGAGYDLVQVTSLGFERAPQTLTANDLAPKNVATNAAGTTVARGFLHRSFGPFELEPYAKAAGVPVPTLDKVTLTYFRQPIGATATTVTMFRATFAVQKELGTDKWDGAVICSIQPAESQAAAPAVVIPDKLSLKLEMRQDGKKDEVGILATLKIGDTLAHFTKNGKPPEMTVTVKAKNGDVVKKDSAGIDQFGLG